MRRFSVLVPLFAILLAGLVVAAGRLPAVAQQQDADNAGTPAAEDFIPEGVTFEALGFGSAEALQEAPGEVALFRIGVEPGAFFPIDPGDPALALVYLENGTVTINVDAPIMVLRAAGEGTPFPEEQEEMPAGTEFTLQAGDSAIFPPRVGGEARNEGSEQVSLLVASVGPGLDAGAATPTS